MQSVSRPPFAHRPTSETFHQRDTSSNDQSGNPSDSKSIESSADRHVEIPAHAPGSGPHIHDVVALLGVLALLIWSWIFFGAIWAKGGIQMNNHVAKVVTKFPHATTYFITLIGTIISMIVTAVFSHAIIRFAQESVTYHKARPFELKVLLAFRHQAWPWGRSWRDMKYLMVRNRWFPAALVAVCVFTFPHLISSATSLLTPTPFSRTALLTTTELDLSSTKADCLAWFNANPLPNNCSWQSFNGLRFTNCVGTADQMVDILESGRGNMFELLNEPQTITFSQVGGKDGVHFLGPIPGVLPIGPNGVTGFNSTLAPSPFSDPKIVEGIISYNYTLDLQGFSSDVNCSYEPTSPIALGDLVPGSNLGLIYDANCTQLGGADLLPKGAILVEDSSVSTLLSWICQSAPDKTQAPSYSVYLRGINSYENVIGNITCAVNPLNPAIYPVRYQSSTGIFSATAPTSSAPIGFAGVPSSALVAMEGMIAGAQNFQANLVAEAVISFGTKSFDLQSDQPSPKYLQLFEQMIQGIIEYETTYLRLIYSTVPNPPASCIRTVTGSISYEVLGWFVTSSNIGFLIPVTIINLAALFALCRAVAIARAGGYLFHPLEPRPVVYDESANREDQVPDEWKQKVMFQPTTVLGEFFGSSDKETPPQ